MDTSFDDSEQTLFCGGNRCTLGVRCTLVVGGVGHVHGRRALGRRQRRDRGELPEGPRRSFDGVLCLGFL